MHWVLQANMFNEVGFSRLIDALQRLQISHTFHKVIPFIGTLSRPMADPAEYLSIEVPDEDTDLGLPDGPKIVMGSYSMAGYAQRKGWTPGSFAYDTLDYEKQVPHWGGEMLNSDAWVGRFADVLKQKHEFFIRPTLDSKSFAGVVMGWSVFRRWQENVLKLGADNGGTLDGDTLVQVCSKKTILREYRLWVVDGKVKTASLYKLRGRPNFCEDVEPEVLAYGEEMAALWSPGRAYVLDICRTPDRLKILEAGCMNAAGFYAADMQKLVMALETAFA